MKKIVLHPIVAQDYDLFGGPSGFARYDIEGHGMDMSRYRRDFLETREEVAKKLNLPTTDPMVRSQARWIVRHEHYEPDLLSSQIENSGTEEYDGQRDFAMINGQATYLHSDGSASKYTFSSFHERTKEDKDEKVKSTYSEEAHRLDLFLQSTLQHATKPIEVTKFGHDANGIRDAYTFSYDPVTNRGKVRIRNMAPDGNFLTVEQAREKMRSFFPNRHELQAEKNIFVLTNEPTLQEEKVSATYKQLVQENITRPSGVTEIATIAHTAVQDITDEIGYTARSVSDFFQRRKEEAPIKEPEMAEEEKERGEISLTEFFVDADAQWVWDVLSHEPSEHNMSTADPHEASLLWRAIAEEKLDIDHESSAQLLTQVEMLYEQTTNTHEVLKIMSEDQQTQEALSPVFFSALEILASAQEIKNSPHGQEASRVEKINYLEEVFVFLNSDNNSEEKIQKNIPDVDMMVLGWIKDMVASLEDAPIEKVIEIVEHKEEIIVMQISEIWEHIVEKYIQDGSTTEQKIDDEEYDVKKFSFAFALWLIFKLDAYYQSLQSIRAFVIRNQSKRLLKKEKTHESFVLVQELQKQKEEEFVPKESTKWVLLGIIWHLAMIREQALSQGNAAQAVSNKKKGKTKTNSSLRPTGVIFTFAS